MLGEDGMWMTTQVMISPTRDRETETRGTGQDEAYIETTPNHNVT